MNAFLPSTDRVLHQAAGLQQLMGDRPLYREILRRFRQRYAHAATEAQAAYTAGDHTAVLHMLHTLKGAAGMIGAQQVSALTAALEATNCALPLTALQQALDQLMAEIDVELATEDDAEVLGAANTPEEAEPEADATSALLQQLAQLLDSGNGAAIDVLDQSASTLTVSLGAERYQQVAAAAQQFDFETALAYLQQRAD